MISQIVSFSLATPHSRVPSLTKGRNPLIFPPILRHVPSRHRGPWPPSRCCERQPDDRESGLPPSLSTGSDALSASFSVSHEEPVTLLLSPHPPTARQWRQREHNFLRGKRVARHGRMLTFSRTTCFGTSNRRNGQVYVPPDRGSDYMLLSKPG
jgi:hypothetical protein